MQRNPQVLLFYQYYPYIINSFKRWMIYSELYVIDKPIPLVCLGADGVGVSRSLCMRKVSGSNPDRSKLSFYGLGYY